MKKIWIILCFLLLPEVSAAFIENTSVPTQNNTPIPINSSSSTQVKTGALVSNSYMQADVFYDRYNSGYYLQPRATNRLNYVVADNTLTYGNSITNGEVQGAFFRDRNNGNFYVDPNNWSIVRNIQADIYYDRNNTGYYVDPSGTNRMNYILADNIYAYGTGNFADVYLRSAGRWASQMAVNPQIHSWGLFIENNGNFYRERLLPHNGRNYCSLNKVIGRYEGGAERAEVWIEGGWWWLGGHSRQDDQHITAYCLSL